ncbi:hypothetical protein MUK42_07548 [Musa troglodytarum]|uniref:Uncharacterized protein n=1 Tax=Musa troglodytarum TaxID=320322 RepID=A0A9E7IA00_9LILI|nr:hypothetical protein MUK42_07548 [Musa troglodytarum]
MSESRAETFDFQLQTCLSMIMAIKSNANSHGWLHLSMSPHLPSPQSPMGHQTWKNVALDLVHDFLSPMKPEHLQCQPTATMHLTLKSSIRFHEHSPNSMLLTTFYMQWKEKGHGQQSLYRRKQHRNMKLLQCNRKVAVESQMEGKKKKQQQQQPWI